MKNHNSQPQGYKIQNFKTTLKLLLKRLGQHKILVTIGIFCAIAGATLSMLGTKFLYDMMSLLFTGHTVIEEITRYGILILSLYLLSALCGYFEGYTMSVIAVTISKDLRTEISKKINKLPLAYFDRNSYGDLLSRVTNDIHTMGDSLGSMLTTIVSSIVTLIGIPIIMFTISWQLTLICLLQIPLALLVVFIVVKFNQKHFANQQKYLGDVNGFIEEHFTAHNVIKAFNGEEKAKREFDILNSKLKQSSRKAQFYSGLMHPIVNLVSNIIYVLICIICGWLAIQTNNPSIIATMNVFMIYSKQFNQPISQIGSVFSNLQATVASSERVFDFLAEQEEKDESEKNLTIKNVKGKIEFKHVNFGYTPDKQIIYDFNFTALPGQKIAIVGQTGAGKTTMVNLLMRFYEISSGQILIDGKPIDKMKRSYVRSLFGMVLQETWLFEGTIMENLKFGRPEATDEEVIEDCKMANVDHFIRTEPGGYNMVLNENTEISAGQKQLLTIARAMVQQAPMLILDEATSSVDTRTEILIQTAMDRLTKHKTSFVIAHRLSTIKNADQIIVMKDGNIVEIGKHEELLALNGVYKDLYTSQFEHQEESKEEL